MLSPSGDKSEIACLLRNRVRTHQVLKAILETEFLRGTRVKRFMMGPQAKALA